MFENIISQDHVISLLSQDIREDKLPSSLLFCGNDYTGKLSTALELGRVLSCEEGSAQWDCPCKACEMHRLLIHPDTLMMGSRYFAEEIAASASTLMRTRQRSAQYLFVRAVRKLTRRFDPAFTEMQDSRFKRAQADLAFLEENIHDFEPGAELPDQRSLEKRLLDMVNKAARIDEGMRGESIQIDSIRRASAWAHLKGTRNSRLIILENADRMSDGAKNALLKILEEPPSGVFLVLLTTRREAIIPTILSRVRQYQFVQRTEDQETEVIRKIFRDEPDGEVRQRSLRDYLFGFFQVDIATVRNDAAKFLSMLLEPESFSSEEFALIVERERDDRFFKPFLEEVSRSIRSMFATDPAFPAPDPIVRVATCKKWNTLLSQTVSERELYNLNPSLLLEGLFYQMRETV
ncbi:MAG TPA: hypothetical protein PLG43_00245 [Spirochaetia bacterium]|nr:hypothetical protein [Spirochaetia bacterium]